MGIRLTRVIAVVLAAATLAAGGCSYFDVKQREWIFRPQRDLHSTPADVGLRYDELWLTVQGAGPEGERVHGWWIPAADAAAPAMLYLHGARWSLSNNLHRIGRLHRMGFAVLAIDYRGFGRSDGDLPSEAQAYADAQAAWERLRRLVPDPRRRFLYGHSLGGAVAIELATHNDDVAGLIVESTFTSIRDMVDALGYTSFSVDGLITQRFDSLAKVPAVSAPILFVHGTADRFVPPTMTEKLYSAAREPKRLLLVENAGHSNSTGVGFENYLSAVRDLVDLAARLGATRIATPGRPG
ncbi:MAG TPA: alpha/beta fold hydrolase [Burkholderiales bacterium]|nr:alpha/beta fold hydrolase [Burkholderiales bacterium]